MINLNLCGFSEITGHMKVKFYVGPPCLGGTKYCARNLGRMLNMSGMLTNAQKSPSPEPMGRFSRNLVCIVSGTPADRSLFK